MAFLEKLLGGSFEGHLEKAEALFAARRFGEAKLAFERAMAKAKGVPEERLFPVREKVRLCRRALAERRIEDADRLVADGDLEAAEEMLRDALDICEEPEIAGAVKARRERNESRDARSLAGAAEMIGEEELLSILAGTWTEPQAEEYAALPESLGKALLAGHDGDHARAAEELQALADRTDLPVPPRYLYFDLGKTLAQAGLHDRAIGAWDAFLAKVPEGESPDLHAATLSLRAASLSRLERHEEAKAGLIQATLLRPEDHTVFLNLGVFLRGRGEHEEALAALQKAAERMGQMQPDIRVIREIGLTYLAMGRKDEAQRSLGAVIEHLASRGEHDQFDPETAVALARLHEEKGDLAPAADLFRHLALGYDTQNHFTYNLEAARLLKAGRADPALVERYLVRAAELASGDEQAALVDQIRR